MVSNTQCLQSKKQSSSGRNGRISYGDMFFLPPPNTLSMFGLCNFIISTFIICYYRCCPISAAPDKIGNTVLIVLAFYRSARPIFHRIQRYLFHINLFCHGSNNDNCTGTVEKLTGTGFMSKYRSQISTMCSQSSAGYALRSALS